MIIPDEQDLLAFSDWNNQEDLLVTSPISISHSVWGSKDRDLTHFCACVQATTVVAKSKQRNKYESSKVTVYIKNKGTALDVTAQSDKLCNPPDQKKKKIRTLRRCTKGISFQTSKSIQRQNQKQKLWFFKSDLHKSVLCLFPFSFTV